jgi:2-methylisocitrate lyase-like PEP mutase family enzyme
VPGLSRAADIAEVVRSVTAPLNVLLQSGGLGLAELGDLGVARVSTGSLLYRAALHAAVTTAVAARDGGRAPEGLPSYADVERLLPS